MSLVKQRCHPQPAADSRPHALLNLHLYAYYILTALLSVFCGADDKCLCSPFSGYLCRDLSSLHEIALYCVYFQQWSSAYLAACRTPA